MFCEIYYTFTNQHSGSINMFNSAVWSCLASVSAAITVRQQQRTLCYRFHCCCSLNTSAAKNIEVSVPSPLGYVRRSEVDTKRKKQDFVAGLYV